MMFVQNRVRRLHYADLYCAPRQIRKHHPDFDKMAASALPGADSLTDRDIPTFSRRELRSDPAASSAPH